MNKVSSRGYCGRSLSASKRATIQSQRLFVSQNKAARIAAQANQKKFEKYGDAYHPETVKTGKARTETSIYAVIAEKYLQAIQAVLRDAEYIRTCCLS